MFPKMHTFVIVTVQEPLCQNWTVMCWSCSKNDTKPYLVRSCTIKLCYQTSGKHLLWYMYLPMRGPSRELKSEGWQQPIETTNRTARCPNSSRFEGLRRWWYICIELNSRKKLQFTSNNVNITKDIALFNYKKKKVERDLIVMKDDVIGLCKLIASRKKF